jgi:hypothetical protein
VTPSIRIRKHHIVSERRRPHKAWIITSYLYYLLSNALIQRVMRERLPVKQTMEMRPEQAENTPIKLRLLLAFCMNTLFGKYNF